MVTVKEKNSEISGIYEYAKNLKKTELPDKIITVFTEAQAQLIKDNLYTKSETAMTLQEVFAQFEKNMAADRAKSDNRMAELDKKTEANRIHHEKEMLKMENRIDKKFSDMQLYFEQLINRTFTKTISILGTLIGLLAGVMTLLHFFVGKGG